MQMMTAAAEPLKIQVFDPKLLEGYKLGKPPLFSYGGNIIAVFIIPSFRWNDKYLTFDK
jgi:hypothetical protein